MTYQLNQRELVIDLATGDHQINIISHSQDGFEIIGPVDYGWARYQQALKTTTGPAPDVFTWGGGPLAGSRIPGTRRLVLCAYSPQWEGFYVSSLGGAAYIMHRVGVDFVSIHGTAPHDSVLVLNHKQGEISVRLEAINPDAIWSGYAGPTGERQIGFYALQQAVYDRFSHEYEGDWVRVFAVGPAARSTDSGIIGSNHIKKGQITPIDDWAGRGGLGSRLLQQHRLAACIFGGDWEDPDLKDSQEIDSYFQQYYGDSMIKVDLGATEKYRYAPGFQTGGTFGVNMHTVDDNLVSFNYTSVYQSDQKRLDQHKNFVLGHYLKQYNEEIIQPKNFAHCGEPCSVACKKFDGIYKKDFEPYQALGPLCGVFDQRAAEQLNHFVDAMGIDAIQIGCTVAWMMELIADGLVPPRSFGLPPAGEMSFHFEHSPENFDVINDSQRNAAYAQKVVAMLVLEEAGAPFRQGIRPAAKHLADKYDPQILDRAVYIAHGSTGNMTPNQYWVPGMLAPMPMMGKYFTYYGIDYQPPRELGRLCVQRMLYELYSENSGVCRFHRKWAETIIDEIIGRHYFLPLDYKSHQFELARQIYEHDGNQVVFWENERTIDLVWQYLDKWGRHGLVEPSLHLWLERFRQDKWRAARAYWDEVRAGIQDAFEAGPNSIPDMVPPHRSASAARRPATSPIRKGDPFMSKYVAAIDQGTTSTRCMIFNHSGQVVSIAQKEHRQIYPQPGWVEHDPLEIWERTQDVVRQAILKAGAGPGDIAAIGITNQRETTLVWDPRTGQPYYNAIVWQDTRTKPICDELMRVGGQDRFRAKTGLPLATYFSGPKIKWLLDNVAGLHQAAERGEAVFGNIDTWIIWQLTGGPKGGALVTDVTNASRTLLMNLETLEWDREILDCMGIPAQMLPRIVPSSDPDTWGLTTLYSPFGDAIPVCGDLGDQQAALVGQTCFNPGEAKNTYGTGCFMLLNTGVSPVPSKSGLLTTLGYQIGDQPAVYALEGSIAITGALVQWLRDNLGIINKSSEVEDLARTVEDNGGLYFVPAFSGLFAPYWRSDARGVIAGMTRFANKGHLARAALEATAFQTREVLDAMNKDSGVDLKALKVDGGMVYNKLLMQFQADILNVPVMRPRIAETTSLGAAYAAGLAVGFWNNLEDLRLNWQIDTTWQPQMDSETRSSLYQGWLKAVERTFDWLE